MVKERGDVGGESEVLSGSGHGGAGGLGLGSLVCGSLGLV
jgi:hypothetical protein